MTQHREALEAWHREQDEAIAQAEAEIRELEQAVERGRRFDAWFYPLGLFVLWVCGSIAIWRAGR